MTKASASLLLLHYQIDGGGGGGGLLKILSDLQINICSPGWDREYLRTNNKIFRKLTIQHLLLSGFILNNLLKYQYRIKFFH